LTCSNSLPSGQNSNAPTISSEIPLLKDKFHSEFSNSRSINTSPSLFVIPPVTRNIVEQDLRKISSNKATGLDGISICILKLALPAISPSLEHIYNASISSGIIPVALKRPK